MAIVLALMVMGVPAVGQDPVYLNYTTANGLPSNTVYNIAQDSKGYIWIANDRGLSRYDGVAFAAYKASMEQGRSLTNLMESARGIWAQDFTGNFYTPEADSLQHFSKWSGVRPYFALSTIIQRQLLVALGYDSIRTYNLATKKCEGFKMPGIYQPAVFTDSDTLYFVTNSSLYSFDGEKINLLFSWQNKIPQLYFLQKTKRGFAGFTQKSYPYAYELQPGEAKPVSLFAKGTLIQEINATNNQIWIGTTKGAYCFDQWLQPCYGGYCFFKERSVSRITCDREGTFWFATLDRGIFKVPNLATRLYPYRDEAITALALKDEATLLAGTSSQRLLAFSAAKGSFTALYKDDANHEIIHILHEPAQNTTLLCSDKVTRLRHFGNPVVYSKAGKSGVSIAPDQYVIAYSNGITTLNLSPDRPMPPWIKGLSFLDSLGNFRGRLVAYYARQNMLLAATTKGLFYITPQHKGAILQNGKPVYASCMVALNGHTIISTYQGEVYLLSPQRQLRSIYRPRQKQAINKLQVSHNTLWMLTDKGILAYDTLTKSEQQYTIADGLPKAEYKDLMLQNDVLHVATSAGLVVFKQKLPSLNTVPPLMAIDNIMVNGHPASMAMLKRLPSDNNNLSIAFSVLAYKNEAELRIKYKVNQQDWQQVATGVRTINLLALGAGQYKVTIVAQNEDGIACMAPLQLDFVIKAPFFRQPWFVVSLLALLLASVFFYYNQKLKRQKRDNELRTQQMQLEQDLQKSKLTSIKSQMNPHFFFNALNTIQSYIYTNDKLQATRYLNKFSVLTRLILEQSNKDLITLEDEIKALTLYLELEAERFGNKLNYAVQVKDDVMAEAIRIPPMLIQPYVENAIKHGLMHSKAIWNLLVEFKTMNNGLLVVIDDNGIGRKKSEQINKSRPQAHQSFAMNANQSRLEILNKGFSDEIGLKITDKLDTFGQPTGTRVELFIPNSIAGTDT
ncbi:MAG: histidine kinase [Chitinophagaceae bacterium]|nr:histidine kinase [Chitinophagaceae bacterium]